ncbi:hypothetical protein ACHAXA_008463 [Cyclostephanos tholiformis]|uniref:PDZ domain-containing protein n=1 Tax=Cyclostephanos tholiformis TaxID=382380 RepID=A0ABD3SB99_9STRA
MVMARSKSSRCATMISLALSSFLLSSVTVERGNSVVLLPPIVQAFVAPRALVAPMRPTTASSSFTSSSTSSSSFRPPPTSSSTTRTAVDAFTPGSCGDYRDDDDRHDEDDGIAASPPMRRDFIGGLARSTALAASVVALSATSALSFPSSSFAVDMPPSSSSSSSPSSVTTYAPRGAPPAYDEAWTLIKKYALDRSYNGQDWDDAYTTYSDGLPTITAASSTPDAGDSYDEGRTMKAVTNLVSSLGDRYTRILDREAYARIQKFDLIGVGATLMPDPNTQEIIVGAPPVSKSAADMAGLKAGDVIVAVNGIDTNGRTAFDIIDQISEDPKQSTITFSEDGTTTIRDVVMKRDFPEVRDPISYRITETRSDGTKVGYVRIAEFNSLVKPRLEAALRDLESHDANAYVVDVRGNPGGAFQSAIEIAGLFMSDRLATDVVDGNGVDLKFRTSKDRVVVGESDPLAIWVDGGSASASEVLAGALRDNCRAVVMGSTSFGKGLVQAVYGLKNGYGLVLTVAKYLTPGGTDINKVGIIPDVPKEEALPSVPGFVPVIGSDTSRVDFGDVKRRMAMCSIDKMS